MLKLKIVSKTQSIQPYFYNNDDTNDRFKKTTTQTSPSKEELVASTPYQSPIQIRNFSNIDQSHESFAKNTRMPNEFRRFRHRRKRHKPVTVQHNNVC